MKSRDIFLPSLSGVLIIGLMIFQSCAHQNRYAEDVDVPDEENYAQSDLEPESDSSSAEAPVAENEEKLESLDKTENSDDLLAETDNLNKNSSETDSLEAELEAKDKPADDLAFDETSAKPLSKEPSFEDELENDLQAPQAKLESSETMPAETSLESKETDPLLAEESAALSPSVIQPKTDELEAKETISPQIDNLISEQPAVSKPIAKRSGSFGVRKVPKIPAKAITKKGSKLNRFYFVRKSDTPKKVSNLIYGNASKAKLLTKWNGKAWTPGKLIYYSSPINPKDPKMESFYKENKITANEYRVQKGDWLSKIAKNQLGDSGSWVEIAVINGINSPKSLEVGQQIAIYPLDLKIQPEEPVIAQVEPTPAPVQVAPPVEPPQAALEPAKPVEPEPTVVEPPAPVKTEPVGFDLQKFIDQNMFAGLMGLAAVFLVLLLVVKKRKQARAASSDDFENGEDNLQPPTKLKRR